MKAITSTLILFAAAASFGACAAHSSPATHGGSGSAGGGGGDDPDAGIGSGSDATPPPPPGTLYGTVLDERGDTIDFSTGEPVHTHAGPSIDLGAGGCPAVYKYAYLEDENDPEYGSQTTTNPLAWHVTSAVGSLDDSATAYRVRAADGTVLLDYTPTAPDGTGLYTVQLYRDLMPALGDHTGKMYVDVRFRDTAGNETVDTACWDNHPLAAPLEVTPLAKADLFGWSLPANSPISTAIHIASIDDGYGTGADVLAQDLVQHTAEPVTVRIDHSDVTGTASMTSASVYVNAVVTTAPVGCTGPNDASCAIVTAPAPVGTPSAGPLRATWNLRVVDTATGAIACHNVDGFQVGVHQDPIPSCVLPGRTSGEAPHTYKLVLSMGQATAISPILLGDVEEWTAGSYAFTGAPPQVNDLSGCSHRVEHIVNGNPLYSCSEETSWTRLIALDAAHIDLDAISIVLQSAPDATAALEDIPYAAADLAIGATAWDAGDEGLLP